MSILLGLSWALLVANPFDLDEVVDPAVALPLVSFNICLIAIGLFGATRMCHHGIRASLVLLWAVAIILCTKVIVFGHAPLMALAGLIVSYARTVVSDTAMQTRVGACVIALLLFVGTLCLCDPSQLQSVGGYRAFHTVGENTSNTATAAATSLVLGLVSIVYTPETNPTQVFATASAVALAFITVVGFIAGMAQLDSMDSLTSVDFFHTCFIFAWSGLIAAMLMLLIAFHVLRQAYDAYCIMAIATLPVLVVQVAVHHQPVSQLQYAGLALVLFGAVMFVTFRYSDEYASANDHSPFYACAECAAERVDEIEDTLGCLNTGFVELQEDEAEVQLRI